MARHLHLDMPSGAGGDMLLAAFCDLGFSLEPLRDALAAMGLGEVDLSTETVEAEAIRALRFRVKTGRENGHGQHRAWRDIRAGLARADLTPAVLARVEAMFTKLAEAEGSVHGVPPEQVYFHEVGAVDSIADLLGLSMALEELRVESVSATTPLLGQGLVQSQHGPLPLPAPATLACLVGLPVKRLALEAELTTPTAACFLATQVQTFGPPPVMRLVAVGYGAGSRRLPDRPNVLRAWLGENEQSDDEQVWQVEVNIDDMTGEQLAYLMERLLDARALDVWFVPLTMKKSRPAVSLGLLCAESDRAALEDLLLEESSSFGLRRWRVERRKLSRRIVRVVTDYGMVRVKLGGEAGPAQTVAPEFEDCKRLALAAGLPIKEVFAATHQAFRQGRLEPGEEGS
ncbi:MAG: nickel pincer cofactor biosynthesis protein LarC [Deltaproteobacteria bacterium]|nr:nickel pincer cofactor biosynthesis protein LarC [Deltaproteobacteria bacterium]